MVREPFSNLGEQVRIALGQAASQGCEVTDQRALGGVGEPCRVRGGRITDRWTAMKDQDQVDAGMQAMAAQS